MTMRKTGFVGVPFRNRTGDAGNRTLNFVSESLITYRRDGPGAIRPKRELSPHGIVRRNPKSPFRELRPFPPLTCRAEWLNRVKLRSFSLGMALLALPMRPHPRFLSPWILHDVPLTRP